MNGNLAHAPSTCPGVIPAPGLALERARAAQASLEAWLFSPQAMGLPLDEVEREQEARGREVQRRLLQAHLAARGTGDVGPALEVLAPEEPQGLRLHTHRREHPRHLATVFGEVEIRREGYGAEGAHSVHPLDTMLALPARSYSYELERRQIKAAVQGPFDEAVERIEEATGVSVPKRSVEQVVKEAAVDFETFYAERRPAEGTPSTGSIVVGAVDGKGIPMVKPQGAARVVRRGKGEKANKKRMATVAAVFTQAPRGRTPEDVIESLFRTGPRLVGQDEGIDRVRPEGKRVWASLKKSKEEVIAQVGEEMARRDPQCHKIHVVVTDGERALQRRVESVLPGVILILDLLHVLEYLWKAAYVFHAEGSAAAMTWVKERALRILRGEVSEVVRGMRQSATKRRLRGAKRKVFLGAAGYLYHNRDRMRYPEYLAAGLPIASGAVEGACKNLIKDRMERSGMRWTEDMAEAMVKLRAIYLSGDFEEYWAYHRTQNQHRLHPPGQWRVVESVVEK